MHVTLQKSSQFLNPDGFRLSSDELADLVDNQLALDSNELEVSLELEPENEQEAELLVEEKGEVSGSIKFETDGKDIEEEFSFSLPLVPGGLNQDDIEIEPEEIVVEDDNRAEDPWSWGKDPSKFVEWFASKVQSVPPHSGSSTGGCLRSIQFLKKCISIGKTAVQNDIEGKIDDAKVEKIIDECLAGISRLEQRIDTLESIKRDKFKKKKASVDAEDEIDDLIKEGEEQGLLVKEAQTGPVFGVQVDYFISNMSRLIINAGISGGHSMEKSFWDLDEKYKFNEREKLQVISLIKDMGFHIFGDRYYVPGEKYDPTSSDNYDYSASRQA